MKKFACTICAVVLLIGITSCSINEIEINQEGSDDLQNVEEGLEDIEASGANIFEEAINDGIITEEESEKLMAYLKANDPGKIENQGPGEETASPFTGAAKEGIISDEQASLLKTIVELSSMDVGQGSMTGEGGPGADMENMMSIEDANKVEKELLDSVGYKATIGGYPIVDTNQTSFFSNDGIIDEPAIGQAFYGQDASYAGHQPSYTDNGDGTVTDNVTGLVWQQDPGEKMDWETAVNGLDAFNEEALGGYSDWRIPTIKELYSLVDFSGSTRTSSDTSVPYINTDYFVFMYGDEAGEPRFIDSQILTSTIYDSDTLGGNTTVFGYNFADGRIKGYEITKDFYCYHVRGNTSYGQNLFVDNGDETVTDEASGLMWMQNDSGYYEAGAEKDGTMNWEEALAWVGEMNEDGFLGYSDWRLPNVKELQSLVDYTKSPITTDSPAIDDLFYCSPIINCFGQDDYGYYWSGTTHDDTSASTIEYNAASYVVFGKAMGLMDGNELDAHGSGSQKSDPKTGERSDYPVTDENAPQGDEQRVYNMVRMVRDAK